jgi:hypothetical protein
MIRHRVYRQYGKILKILKKDMLKVSIKELGYARIGITK